jgi:hypothetical protein
MLDSSVIYPINTGEKAMLRLKKVVFLVMLLFTIAMLVDWSSSDAQTKKGSTVASPTTADKDPGRANTLRVKRDFNAVGPNAKVSYQTFNHAVHSPDCESCHTSEKYDQRVVNYPDHPACENCHAFQQFSISYYNPKVIGAGFCKVCHTPDKKEAQIISKDSDYHVKPFPEQRDDQFGIYFPHSVHEKVKSQGYNFGTIDFATFRAEPEYLKLQQAAINFGCNECHIKDSQEKKEENYSMPGHTECARCHGFIPKKSVPPFMNDCRGCHKPFMATHQPSTNIVSLIEKKGMSFFRHDKDHEEDTRPDAKKVEKGQPKPLLECNFCHKDTVKSNRTQDIVPPYVSNCTACHFKGKGASGHELELSEIVNLRPDPPAKK